MPPTPHVEYRPTSAAANRSGSDAQPFGIHTVFVALRCWWKLLFPAAIVIALVGGAATYFLHTPKYTAQVWLEIKDRGEWVLRPVETQSVRLIQNQMEIIRSARLLGPVVARPGIADTPELVKEEDLPLALAKQLKITQRGQSDLFILSYTSRSSSKAALIVKEVAEAYIAFHRKLESEQDNRIIRLLEEQRELRKREREQLREKVRALSLKTIGVDPFLVMPKENDAAKPPHPLANLEADIVRLEVDQEFLAAYIRLEEENNEEPVAAPGDVAKAVDEHPAVLSLLARIERARIKEKEYQNTSKDLSKSPNYQQLQAALAGHETELEQTKADLRKRVKEDLEGKLQLAKADGAYKLKREYAAAASKLVLLKERFEKEMGSLRSNKKELTGDTLALEFQRADHDRVAKVVEEISARILAIQTEQRAPDRAAIFDILPAPIRPDELVPWKKIGLAAGAAFCLPFALAVGWEHIFRRVSSRSQLELTPRISVVGEVTVLPSKRLGIGGGRKAVREMLLFEESVDGLRTYLSLLDSLRGIKVLAVTSAVSGEGKTSLAAQLAVSIARATGELTLLIDGDLRSPDLHGIFGGELSPGLAEVLKNECPLDEAIEKGFSEKLHLLTAGRLTQSPHRLVGNGFADLLAELSKTYKHIIVDTPPILPASEALVMAKCACAAVLCVRRDYSRLDQVQEAHRRMETAGVKTAGAVINGIPHRHYTHKYGTYGYHHADETEAI